MHHSQHQQLASTDYQHEYLWADNKIKKQQLGHSVQITQVIHYYQYYLLPFYSHYIGQSA